MQDQRVADGRVLKLIESFLAARIMEGLEQWTPASGAPQGAVLSPLLSNIYLNPLDHQMAQAGKDTIRAKTRRTDGRALEVIIQDVNRTMRGWFGYFKHSHRAVFAQVDGWARDRIRSLLRKRHKLRGRANATDRKRWTIAFFARQGFYSLSDAYARARRPMKVAH